MERGVTTVRLRGTEFPLKVDIVDGAFSFGSIWLFFIWVTCLHILDALIRIGEALVVLGDKL